MCVCVPCGSRRACATEPQSCAIRASTLQLSTPRAAANTTVTAATPPPRQETGCLRRPTRRRPPPASVPSHHSPGASAGAPTATTRRQRSVPADTAVRSALPLPPPRQDQNRPRSGGTAAHPQRAPTHTTARAASPVNTPTPQRPVPARRTAPRPRSIAARSNRRRRPSHTNVTTVPREHTTNAAREYAEQAKPPRPLLRSGSEAIETCRGDAVPPRRQRAPITMATEATRRRDAGQT